MLRNKAARDEKLKDAEQPDQDESYEQLAEEEAEEAAPVDPATAAAVASGVVIGTTCLLFKLHKIVLMVRVWRPQQSLLVMEDLLFSATLVLTLTLAARLGRLGRTAVAPAALAAVGVLAACVEHQFWLGTRVFADPDTLRAALTSISLVYISRTAFQYLFAGLASPAALLGLSAAAIPPAALGAAISYTLRRRRPRPMPLHRHAYVLAATAAATAVAAGMRWQSHVMLPPQLLPLSHNALLFAAAALRSRRAAPPDELLATLRERGADNDLRWWLYEPSLDASVADARTAAAAAAAAAAARAVGAEEAKVEVAAAEAAVPRDVVLVMLEVRVEPV